MKKLFAVIAIAGLIVATLAWLITKRPASSPQPALSPSLSPSPSPTPTSYGGQTVTSTRVFLPSIASPEPTSIETSSKTQCAEGERLITIPTSSEFAVDETPFCSKLNVGSALVSPDEKWTAAIESLATDVEGRLYYHVGAGLWEADHNIYLVFRNRVTGEQNELGIARVVLQGDVAQSFVGERMESNIAGWSTDGKELWGWASFAVNAGDPGIGDFSAQPLRAAFFKIDTTTWQAESYYVPVPVDHSEVGVNSNLSNVLNTDRGIALYGEIIGSSTVSLDIYDFAARVTTTIVSFPGIFKASGCNPNSSSPPFCKTDSWKVEAHWTNSSTVSWVDPETSKIVVRSAL